jgi:hypothetical protein
MTKQTAKPGDGGDARTLIVFGTDEHDKPRAARFSGANSALVEKAAQAMELRVAEITTDGQVEIAKKLPTGRLYSTGRGFVPNVRKDLYAKLLAVLGIQPSGGQGSERSAPAHVYPGSYDEIAAGHLVLVQETLEFGWWEAIVLERNADMLTVRWRDYKSPKFVRHLDAVALIRPPAPPNQPTDASSQ